MEKLRECVLSRNVKLMKIRSYCKVFIIFKPQRDSQRNSLLINCTVVFTTSTQTKRGVIKATLKVKLSITIHIKTCLICCGKIPIKQDVHWLVVQLILSGLVVFIQEVIPLHIPSLFPMFNQGQTPLKII